MEDQNEGKKLYYISVPGCAHFHYLKLMCDKEADLENQETYEHCLYFEKEEDAKELLRKIKECIFNFYESHIDRGDIPYPEWLNRNWVESEITDEITTIQEANTEICKQYEEGVVKEAKNRVCFDGLLYKGELTYEDCNWSKAPSNRNNNKEVEKGEKLWKESEIRPLFITKASNDIEGWDLRKASGRMNFSSEEKIGALYYKNIMRWLCGLIEIYETKKYSDFDSIDEDKKLFRYFDEKPIAIINVNKKAGLCAQEDTKLCEAIGIYGELLKQQILLLQPNVIFCCHGFGCNPIINFLKSEIYKDCREFKSKHNNEGTWIYYSPSMKAMIVHCYSPAYNRKSEELYVRTMREIKDYLPKLELGKFEDSKLKDIIDKINDNKKQIKVSIYGKY